MKEYICACPVCKTLTIYEADFLSVRHYVNKDNKSYPGMPCPNKHKANEVRKILGLNMLLEKDNKIVKGATKYYIHK